MTDTIARTIAALRRDSLASIVAETITISNVGEDRFKRADILALCAAAERGMRADKRSSGTTHYDDCWRYHHGCAVARIERERRCCDELRAVTDAAADPRINNTMTLEEWAREAAEAGIRAAETEKVKEAFGGLRSPPREPRVCAGCGRDENMPRACAYCGTTFISPESKLASRETATAAGVASGPPSPDADYLETARILGFLADEEGDKRIEQILRRAARMIAREAEIVTESERLRALLADAMRDCAPEEGQAWSLFIDEPLHDLIRAAIDAGRKG